MVNKIQNSPELSRLVEHVGNLIIILHDVLHHVSLIPLQGKTQTLDLDYDIEEVEELWCFFLVFCCQVDYTLYLLGQHLQARQLVTYKRL